MNQTCYKENFPFKSYTTFLLCNVNGSLLGLSLSGSLQSVRMSKKALLNKFNSDSSTRVVDVVGGCKFVTNTPPAILEEAVSALNVICLRSSPIPPAILLEAVGVLREIQSRRAPLPAQILLEAEAALEEAKASRGGVLEPKK